MKYARVRCSCGTLIPVPYLYQDDVFTNRVDCGCGKKFFPKYATFDEPSEKELALEQEAT